MDLDGDGHKDVLSGSWPGELFFFRNTGNGDYEKPVKLKDKAGKTINIGGGIQPRGPDGGILIKGDARWEKKDGKQYVVYEGEWIESKPEESLATSGTASAVHAHDWDGDGDYDLVVGDIRGNVYLVPNEGTKGKWSFGNHEHLKAGGQPLRVPGDGGPFVADWDADGKADLLVGAGDGSVWLYRNVARGKGTELAQGRQLLPPVGDQHGENTPAEPTRGTRSKVCAADWNGDGRLDLLVGDFAYLKPKPVELTAEQMAEQEQARKDLEPLQKRYGEIIRAYFDARARKNMTAEQREKQGKELGELSTKMQELQKKIPPEYENHGWVWLFLRKPADQANAAGTQL